MDVTSTGPLRASSIVWQPARGGFVITFVCKATYVLLPGESQLAEEQEYINEDDNHWNDDPARSLYSPSDLVPYKVRGDVMLVGHAFAPRGEPVRSLQAHILIGEIDKSIAIFGERAWAQDGQLRELARFTKMPLRYERAAGGPDTSNPVGVRLDGRPDQYGNLVIPNLQPPGLHLTGPGQVFEPVGFGPIAPAWPSRREKLGRHARGWSDAAWPRRPLPEDIDPHYFNAAPRDQQAQELRENERITLENLHPQHPRLVTSLPGHRPQAFLVRPGAAPSELNMKSDTLWIDTDRSLCTLTWRGQLKLERPDQPGRVVIAMAQPGQRLSFEDVRRMAAGRGATGEEPHAVTLDVEPEPESGRTTITPGPIGDALPFASTTQSRGPAGKPVRQTVPVPPQQVPAEADTAPGIKPNDGAPAWLTRSTGVSALGSLAPSAPMPPPAVAPPPVTSPAIAPPAPVTNPVMAPPPVAPPAVVPGGPARVESPWASMAGGGAPFGQDAASMPSSRQSSPSISVAPSVPPPRSSSPSMPMPSPPSAVPAPAIAPAAVGLSGAALAAPGGSGGTPGGAAQASNAAASASAWASANPAPLPVDAPLPSATIRSSPRQPGGREVTDLLWFDPEYIDRIREEPKWKQLIASLRPKEVDFDGDPFDDAPSKSAQKEKDAEERRDVYGVLTRAETTDLEGVNEAIADAVKDDGTFIRPLVVLSGDITFPFDELETLKATVTAVTPLIAGDKKLKETVDTVNELLKTPWLQSGTGVAEGLTSRVKEAFAQGNRMLPPSYLETHTERILLEQRHYQRRTVFGEPWIRSLFSPPGGSQTIPAYLPEALSKKLPMFQTMRVRVIAEAHLQQDQYETHASALRVIALGRVASLSASHVRGRGA